MTVTLHLTCTAEGVQPWHISCCALTGGSDKLTSVGCSKGNTERVQTLGFDQVLIHQELGFSVAAIDLVLIPITLDQCDFGGNF